MAKVSKKSRSDQAARKALAREAAEMLKAVGRLSSAPDRVLNSMMSFASRLRESSARFADHFRDRPPPRIANVVADECERLARCIMAVTQAGDDNQDRLVATAGVVDASIELSHALVALGSSYRDGHNQNGSSVPSAERVRTAAGEAGFALFEAGVRISQAAGFPTIEPIAFAWPKARSCGCREIGDARGAVPPARAFAANDLVPPVYDPNAVEKALQRLIVSLAKLFGFLTVLARFHQVLLAEVENDSYWPCSDDCTGPSGSIISIKMTKSYASDDGTATPMADGETQLCCSNMCLLFWTELDVEIVPITGVRVGPPLGVGREGPAAVIAARDGLAAIKKKVLAAPPVCP